MRRNLFDNGTFDEWREQQYLDYQASLNYEDDNEELEDDYEDEEL
jgi:hypothetical protein